MPNSWGIINTSDMVDEAWKWIEFSSDADVMLRIAGHSGLIPPRLSLGAYSPWADDPRWGITFQGIAMASTNPLKSPHFERLRKDFIEPALGEIFYPDAESRIGDPLVYWAEQQAAAQGWLNQELGK